MKLVLKFSLICILFVASPTLKGQDALFVWDFSNRDGSTSHITESLTEEFEEVLLQSQCCNLVQRRHYSRLFSLAENEKAIFSLNGLPSSTVEDLKRIKAGTVVFGEVYDDINSGQVKITVNFESFNGALEEKASVYLPKLAINDPEKREEAVKELLVELRIRNVKKPIGSTIIDDWEISLIGCSRDGSNVQCVFKLTSNYRDRDFSLKGVTAYDNYGYEYNRERAGIANKVHGSGFRVRLIDGVETEGFVLFENVSSRASEFKVLEFKVYAQDLSQETIQFREIAIE